MTDVPSHLSAFLASQVTVAPSSGQSVPVSVMHARYEAYCQRIGVPPMGVVAFGMAMYRLGYRSSTEDENGREVTLQAWQGCELTQTGGPG